jgi:allophanate hydrolase
MPLAHYGSFVALIAAPLGIGTLVLEGGERVQGFVCEAEAAYGALDITHLGGWRAFVAQGAAATVPGINAQATHANATNASP